MKFEIVLNIKRFVIIFLICVRALMLIISCLFASLANAKTPIQMESFVAGGHDSFSHFKTFYPYFLATVLVNVLEVICVFGEYYLGSQASFLVELVITGWYISIAASDCHICVLHWIAVGMSVPIVVFLHLYTGDLIEKQRNAGAKRSWFVNFLSAKGNENGKLNGSEDTSGNFELGELKREITDQKQYKIPLPDNSSPQAFPLRRSHSWAAPILDQQSYGSLRKASTISLRELYQCPDLNKVTTFAELNPQYLEEPTSEKSSKKISFQPKTKLPEELMSAEIKMLTMDKVLEITKKAEASKHEGTKRVLFYNNV